MQISQASEQRTEVAPARQVDAEDAAAGEGQHVALGDQIGRREDRQQDLGELARLDREAGDRIQMRAPLTSEKRAGSTAGRIRRKSPTSASVYA